MKRLKDTLIFVLPIAALLLFLISLDERVQMYVKQSMQSSAVTNASATAESFGSLMLVAAREQSAENAPFVIFTAAGLILFVFMFRT
jgi:hypothetical protein